MPHLEKFSENALKASSSRNRTLKGEEPEDEDEEDEEASERREFQAGVDLRLGAIDTTNVNRIRDKKRRTIRKVPINNNNIKYIENKVRMHGKCMNM